MTKLEHLIKDYPYHIAALENNLKRFPKDEARKEHLKYLKGKLKFAQKLKAIGFEKWPHRKVSEVRIMLKRQRDLEYYASQSGS